MTEDGRTEYGDENQHTHEDRQESGTQPPREPAPQPRSEPAPQPRSELARRTLAVPDLSLVVLIGATGSGKSTFAARHFRPTEVLSSDFCRGWSATTRTIRARAATRSRCCTSSRASGWPRGG